ncbi:MAG: efflux RND transporter permease subunit [Leptospirales bacterium]|nr:efflux RND transporter permease subunit [Leptospirales bacterium]
MVEAVIEFSARNRFIVFIAVALGMLAGFYALNRMPLDALPDLSDTQVIIYSRWDRSPDIVEAQVTYPIISAMLGAPRVKSIRGFSDFGYSYVYMIFEEGTDIYWARSRTLEYLSRISTRLPSGVTTELGPDATGVGWVFQYALVDESGKLSLADLRSYQDWYLRYYLQSVPGVAEVAPIGGFVRQYQVNIQPDKLISYNVSLMEVVNAIRDSNDDVGGRMIEFSGIEYMVRGRGYVKSIQDLEDTVVKVEDPTGTPVLVRQVASVTIAPDIRRGISDLNGKGDAVGGIIVMRQGESALRVIGLVKARLAELAPTMPAGLKVVTTYDRTDLIKESVGTVSEVLYEDFAIVAIMILFFLLHVRSALMPILLIPAAATIALLPMHFLDITINVMSITGIVLAVGDMVDVGVVMVENVHSKLYQLREGKISGERYRIIVDAMKEVGPTVFSSLLVTVIGLSPLFTLEGQEGRLFRPLAGMQIFSIFSAAILSITLIPALVIIFLKNAKGISLEDHFATKYMAGYFARLLNWSFEHRKTALGVVVVAMLLTIPIYLRMGSEFMPALYEGTILFMPSTPPGISVAEAHRVLQTQDRILMTFPEVEGVFGKAGRAETSTDPAPFSMMETIVSLKDRSEWRKVPVEFSALPAFVRPWLQEKLPFKRTITYQELVTRMDQALQLPGVRNAWTMPIRARIDMLSTGVRTPVGIKIFGSDLDEIERIGKEIENSVGKIKGARSVFAERTAGGYFIDFDLKRSQLARYGLSIKNVQMSILSAVGGESVSTMISGRERYSINVRYSREQRDSVDKLRRVLVNTMSGAQIPLGQLADLNIRTGPGMIRNENGLLSGFVYVDVEGRDIGSFVDDAKAAVKEQVKLKPGYTIAWSGQYEYMERVRNRLLTVVPLTLTLIFLLYYFNFKSISSTFFIMLAMPFTAMGGIWGVSLLGYNLSVAVWAGMLEVTGIGAALCALVTTFMNDAFATRTSPATTAAEIFRTAAGGATRALRPVVLTCAADILGLLPSMWATGIGAEFVKRYTAPIICGLFVAMVLALVVLPTLYASWQLSRLNSRMTSPS